MLATTDKSLTVVAEEWLARFERALASPADAAGPVSSRLPLAGCAGADLAYPHGRWRGCDHRRACGSSGPRKGRRLSDRSAPARAPRTVTRAGTEAIEAIFRFETAEGRGSGVLRLTPDADGTCKAWTLHTALDALKGHEEKVGRARPKGSSYSRDFRGPNWLDLRKSSAAYADRDPAVLVVGGGQAGLSVAARLTQLQRRHADRRSRAAHRRQLAQALSRADAAQPGARQSSAVHAVSAELADLHSEGQARRWFEAYVESMELNYWTGTDLLSGRYDETAQRWTVDAPPRPTGASGRCIRGTSSWRRG